jgi:hypothetical protein
MKQVYRLSFLISIILSMALTGCMGAVQMSSIPATQTQIGVQATVNGMLNAVNGVAGTAIYQHPGTGWIAMVWPSGSTYGFAIIDQAGKTFKDVQNICGTRCNWMEAADFVAWMEKSGWQSIASGAVPAAISSTIRQFSYLLSIGASLPSIPLIFVLPAVTPFDILNPGVGA